MDIMMTSTVDTSIHAVSPLLATGVDAAAAGAAALAAADAAGAAAAVVAAADAAAATGAEAASATASAATEAPAKPQAARPRAREARSFFMVGCLSGLASERVFASLARADADDLLQRRYENLAVADLAGARRSFDGLDDAVDDRVVDGGFDLHLRQEIDHVFRTA